MKLSLIFTLLLSLFLTAPSANAAQVIEHNYPVYGRSVQELVWSMKSNGPQSLSGQRVWAMTTIKYNYSASYASQGWGCRPGPLRLDIRITVVLPKWVNKKAAPACLQKNWETMRANLKKHEYNHKNRYLAMEKEIYQGVKNLRPQNNCNAVNQGLSNTINGAIARANQWQAQYDNRTRNGQSEGVALNACGFYPPTPTPTK